MENSTEGSSQLPSVLLSSNQCPLPCPPKGTQPSDTRSPEESKKAGNADFH